MVVKNDCGEFHGNNSGNTLVVSWDNEILLDIAIENDC